MPGSRRGSHSFADVIGRAGYEARGVAEGAEMVVRERRAAPTDADIARRRSLSHLRAWSRLVLVHPSRVTDRLRAIAGTVARDAAAHIFRESCARILRLAA